MGPYIYYLSERELITDYQFSGPLRLPPLRVKNLNRWIVVRHNSEEAPNYFITEDFKTFKALTHFTPEEKYNWLKTELINWKLPEGNPSQGILYKPENFDSTKQYPVLVVIYEQYSHRLNKYLFPGHTDAFINVPWFVSRGYLVFMPDLHFQIGKMFEMANNSIVSAMQALTKLPYVDSQRMALIGHSWSGRIVYNTLSHTNLFAAAIAGAGWSDAVSGALTLVGSGYRLKSSYLGNEEQRQEATLWEQPERYIASSPVFRANKITTPLIIFHGMTDDLPWEQGIEMFVALRRNGKRVWMLQYDNGDHGVAGQDAVDYTIRITQFFDHYLNSKLPPKWMTEGIRNSKRGIETGYELDSSGRQP